MNNIYFNERWKINENAREQYKLLFGLDDEISDFLLLEPIKGTERLLQASIVRNYSGFSTRLSYSDLNKHYTIGDNDYGFEIGDYSIRDLVIYYSDGNFDTINIPSNIKNITIVRDNTNFRKGYSQTYVRNSDLKHLKFNVDEKNDCFSSEDGSLYNHDKTKLIHFHEKESRQDVVLPDSLIEIEHDAFHKCNINKLVFPKCFTSLKRGSLNGYIHEMDFCGALCEIESGALLKQISCNIMKINGLLSNINEEGIEELKKWKKEIGYELDLVFAAPQTTIGRVMGNGYIELTKVLTSTEKLIEHADYRCVTLNSYINERFEGKVNFAIPFTTESLILDYNDKALDYSNYKDVYSSISVTLIKFVVNTETKEGLYEILVHESKKRVDELIQESYQSAK